jgi:hypothetical protein
MAYGGRLKITPELQHLLAMPDNRDVARPLLQYFRVLSPGRYLKRWRRRLTEEGFSREDALILSYGSFGFDPIEKTFGVEVVLTNDLNMKTRYERGFGRIQERFQRMTRQLKSPYRLSALPEIGSPEELSAQLPF